MQAPKRSYLFFVLLTVSVLDVIGCEVVDPLLAPLALDYGLPTFEENGGQSTPEVTAGELMAGRSGDGQIGSEWPDMRGKWRIEHFTTLRSELPVILEEIETKVRATIHTEVTQEGADLWLHHQICDVTMLNTPGYNQTIIPDLFIESLPLKTRRAHLLRNNRDGGVFYELWAPLWYDLRAIDLEDPSAESVPMVSSDPRVFDQDRDGSPGLSAKLVGFPDGEVSLIQKSWDEWRGEIELEPNQGNRLVARSAQGSVSWGQEQKIIEATNDVLLIDVYRWIPDEMGQPPVLHYFEMERIEQFSCPSRRPSPRPSQ